MMHVVLTYFLPMVKKESFSNIMRIDINMIMILLQYKIHPIKIYDIIIVLKYVQTRSVNEFKLGLEKKSFFLVFFYLLN